jgi:predicted dehydrogenase
MGGIVAVCDPDRSRLAAAAKKYKVEFGRVVTDMRRIFDDPEISAVIIATPDHWHAPAAILALEAGKHVYVEKPCCHNVREGQLLVAKANETGLVVQHGTQSRSTRLIADGVQLLREGIIGDVLVAKAWNVQRRDNIGHAQPSAPPPELDYDLWVGPAEMVPYQSNRQHYTWHWWYNFGTGDMGNDGVHEIDYARWGLGVETLPTRVAAVGGKYFFDDDQEFPDTQTVAFEYPGDGRTGQLRQLIFELRIWSPSYPYNVDNGAEFYGTRGRMLLTKRGKLEVYDERNRRMEDPRPQSPPDLHAANHHADFLDAIRTGRKPNATIETGFLSAALCNLGNLSARLGRSLTLDPQAGTIVGDDEAQAMLGRTYRQGGHWSVPKNSV